MDIDELSVAYDGKLAVKEVSMPVRQGEVLALIGPSGCGKTTLLRSLNRLTELTRSASLNGRITLDGRDIRTMEPTALRRRVTMVFQQPNPFPMSVFDNLAYVLREQGSRRGSRRSLQDPVCEALDRAGLLEEVKDNLSHPALKLSGGQQQRLCIARALVAKPEVLLLDEPCSALDPQSTEKIEELIVRLREDVAVVIVTHNLQQAYRVADYVGLHVPRRPGRVRRRQEGLRQAQRGPDEGVHQRWLRLALRSGRSAPSRWCSWVRSSRAAPRPRTPTSGPRSRPTGPWRAARRWSSMAPTATCGS